MSLALSLERGEIEENLYKQLDFTLPLCYL
jgi:hypothetical protein